MKNTRLSTIVILLLILLNSVTLAFMWLDKPACPPPPVPGQNPPRPPRPPEGPARFLIEELKFDEMQKAEFDKLKQKHRKATRTLLDSMHIMKEKLFSGIPSGNLQEADKDASEIASLQKRLELATFDHFRQVRALCTSEQKKHFDEITGEVLRMMAPPRGPQGPPSKS